MRRERQGVAPLAGGVDESSEDDDDDGRADEGGEVRIDTLEPELGEDGGQRREDRGPKRPVKPLSTGHGGEPIGSRPAPSATTAAGSARDLPRLDELHPDVV